MAPGCTVTLVGVTRREEEFSGNSNCSDCILELESVVIAFFRTISIGPQIVPARRRRYIMTTGAAANLMATKITAP